jgi:hypothetical protein
MEAGPIAEGKALLNVDEDLSHWETGNTRATDLRKLGRHDCDVDRGAARCL